MDGIICNNKQRWNEDKCECECKELIDKNACDKGFFWNPCNCECECDKSYDIGEYLGYKNCKCRKKLIDPLVEECTENIDETKINNETKLTNENKNENKYSFFVVYIALFSIIFIINIGIDIYFVYHKYVNRNKYYLPY